MQKTKEAVVGSFASQWAGSGMCETAAVCDARHFPTESQNK